MIAGMTHNMEQRIVLNHPTAASTVVLDGGATLSLHALSLDQLGALTRKHASFLGGMLGDAARSTLTGAKYEQPQWVNGLIVQLWQRLPDLMRDAIISASDNSDVEILVADASVGEEIAAFGAVVRHTLARHGIEAIKARMIASMIAVSPFIGGLVNSMRPVATTAAAKH
jgi:hypothetical protein